MDPLIFKPVIKKAITFYDSAGRKSRKYSKYYLVEERCPVCKKRKPGINNETVPATRTSCDKCQEKARARERTVAMMRVNKTTRNQNVNENTRH